MIEHMHDMLAGQFDNLFGPRGEGAPRLDQWRALSVMSPRPSDGIGETEPLTDPSANNAETRPPQPGPWQWPNPGIDSRRLRTA
jgi:hypothetical protein